MRLDSLTEFDEILARHLVVDAERRPAQRPVGLPLALDGAAGDRNLGQLVVGVGIAEDDGAGLGIALGDRHLQHGAAHRRDRQEGRIGLLALLAQRRQHDRHHLVIGLQHLLQHRVEAPGLVDLGGADELVGEAEAVEEGAQARIVAGAEALIFAEGVGHLGQRLVEIGRHGLLVGHVAGHLPEAVHVVGEADEPGRHRVLGDETEGGPHHGRAGDLAEGADMGQAGRAVAGLEDDRARRAVPALQPLHHLLGFLEGPCFRAPGGGDEIGRKGERRRACGRQRIGSWMEARRTL